MGYQKYRANSYCVSERHYSCTKNIVADITFNIKKTGREIKLLVGQCSVCSRKKFDNCF